MVPVFGADGTVFEGHEKDRELTGESFYHKHKGNIARFKDVNWALQMFRGELGNILGGEI